MHQSQNMPPDFVTEFLFSQVNLVNLVAGTWFAWLYFAADILKGYTIVLGALSITVVFLYNLIKPLRFLRGKEED